MKIFYTKRFLKGVKKLPSHQQSQVQKTLFVFEKNPLEPSLRNHRLQGVQKEYYSISAAYDLRLIFQQKGGYAIVLFIDVGKHEKVYE